MHNVELFKCYHNAYKYSGFNFWSTPSSAMQLHIILHFFLQQRFNAIHALSPVSISGCLPPTSMCSSATFLTLLSLLPFDSAWDYYSTGVTFGRYTFSYSKPFHFVEHVRAHDPLEISSRPPGGRTSSVKNQWFMQNKNFSTIFGIFAVACMSSVVTSDVLTSDLLFWEIFLMSDILSTNMMLTELS